MIERCIADWHDFLRGKLEGGLDAVLADDVVFYSPIVFTPQRGKDIAKLYLNAAYATFGGDSQRDPEQSADRAPSFRYVKEVLSGNQAVLEFETRVEGKHVNGVDIITCDDTGKITEFKVMIRPLQAVNLMHAQMRAMLEKMGGQAS